jgi:hypothetical protein
MRYEIILQYDYEREKNRIYFPYKQYPDESEITKPFIERSKEIASKYSHINYSEVTGWRSIGLFLKKNILSSIQFNSDDLNEAMSFSKDILEAKVQDRSLADSVEISQRSG